VEKGPARSGRPFLRSRFGGAAAEPARNTTELWRRVPSVDPVDEFASARNSPTALTKIASSARCVTIIATKVGTAGDLSMVGRS
jgi:hypothetical protein